MKEKEILHLLQQDSRITNKEIAMMLDMAEEEVAAAISQMEAEKVILCYHTIVNWEKAGGNGVTALIDVKVTPEREVGFDKVAERIYRFTQVRSVYLMSGAYDLSVEIEGKDMKEVAMFVAEKLATLDHVQSTATHFVLRKYKQDGVIFEDEEEDRRLVITP